MKVKHAEQVPAEPVAIEGATGVRMRLLIHQAEGAPNFYMRQFLLAPGGCTPSHSHAWEHEVYVLSGAGEVVSPEGPTPVGPGDCLYVAPMELHQFRNTGQAELRFLCLVPKS